MKLAKQTGRSSSLAKYDPHKGVKKIAVAEMAAKHYAKAKDASKLTDAIRAKLEAQAEFVVWWDTQAEKQDGRPTRKRFRSETLIAGRDGLPDRLTIHRWRVKLNDPEKFEEAYAEACSKYSKILEFEKTAHVEHNSGEIEWYTPAEYIEAARRVMDGIDLDPACSEEANKIVQADRIFTRETDGLEQEWSGRVWMNPPYAPSLVKRFTAKLVCHVLAREIEAAVVLVNNATETLWFRATKRRG
jgi:DNA N-6-adenine-methyltransferase (Dam)